LLKFPGSVNCIPGIIATYLDGSQTLKLPTLQVFGVEGRASDLQGGGRDERVIDPYHRFMSLDPDGSSHRFTLLIVGDKGVFSYVIIVFISVPDLANSVFARSMFSGGMFSCR